MAQPEGSIEELVGFLRDRPELLALSRRTPGRLKLDGVWMEYADLHSFYYQAQQIFAQRLYDFDTASPAPVILDCGAHIGLGSLFFARRHPQARITAFEADPRISAMLARNMDSFGLGNVTVAPKAVWTDDGGVAFTCSGDDSGHVADAAGGQGTAVPSVRLRDVIAAQRVDLLKLDIEGAEFAVLEDCAPALGNVERLIAEIHFLQGQAGSLAALFRSLEGAGFQVCLSDLHPATWLEEGKKTPFPCLPTARYIFTVYAWRG
jgi:FkbM family methyltransferase